MQNLPNYT